MLLTTTYRTCRKRAVDCCKNAAVLEREQVKGNGEWNNSAPHGAGRLYSRSGSKQLFTVEEFQNEMHGIYTTTVNQSTLDESPMVYKPMDEIVSLISPTVDIIKIIKPQYNFKAGEE